MPKSLQTQKRCREMYGSTFLTLVTYLDEVVSFGGITYLKFECSQEILECANMKMLVLFKVINQSSYLASNSANLFSHDFFHLVKFIR